MEHKLFFASYNTSTSRPSVHVSTEQELYESIESNKTIYVDNDITIKCKFTFENITNLAIIGTKNISIHFDPNTTLKFVSCSYVQLVNLCLIGDLMSRSSGEITTQFVDCTDCIISHCTYIDGEDEQLCIKGNSDRFDIVNTEFIHHTIDAHAFSILIGKNSTDAPTSGKYHVSLHQCYFFGGSGRNPRFRNAIVHLINCVWTGSALSYEVGPENSDVFFDSCDVNRHPHAKFIRAYGEYRLRYENTEMWKGKNKHNIPDSDDSVELPDYEYSVIPTTRLSDNIVHGNKLDIETWDDQFLTINIPE